MTTWGIVFESVYVPSCISLSRNVRQHSAFVPPSHPPPFSDFNSRAFLKAIQRVCCAPAVFMGVMRVHWIVQRVGTDWFKSPVVYLHPYLWSLILNLMLIGRIFGRFSCGLTTWSVLVEKQLFLFSCLFVLAKFVFDRRVSDRSSLHSGLMCRPQHVQLVLSSFLAGKSAPIGPALLFIGPNYFVVFSNYDDNSHCGYQFFFWNLRLLKLDVIQVWGNNVMQPSRSAACMFVRRSHYSRLWLRPCLRA